MLAFRSMLEGPAAHPTHHKYLIVVIGHSHIRPLQRAAVAREQSDGRFEFVPLVGKSWGALVTHKGRANWVLTPQFASYLEDFSTAETPVRYALTIGGNHHSILGLTNHPEPFCFMNPWKPVEAEGKRVLPFYLMKTLMCSQMGVNLRCLAALAERIAHPTVFLPVPPPASSSKKMLELPSRIYRKAMNEHGVAPSSHRYAMWRLQAEIQQEMCNELGIEYLAHPPGTLDPDGFLGEEFLGDPTHGNDKYGERVLRQLEQHFGTP